MGDRAYNSIRSGVHDTATNAGSSGEIQQLQRRLQDAWDKADSERTKKEELQRRLDSTTGEVQLEAIAEADAEVARAKAKLKRVEMETKTELAQLQERLNEEISKTSSLITETELVRQMHLDDVAELGQLREQREEMAQQNMDMLEVCSVAANRKHHKPVIVAPQTRCCYYCRNCSSFSKRPIETSDSARQFRG